MRLSQADPILTLVALMTDNGLDRPDLINLQPSHYMLQILLLPSPTTFPLPTLHCRLAPKKPMRKNNLNPFHDVRLPLMMSKIMQHVVTSGVAIVRLSRVNFKMAGCDVMGPS